MTTITSPLQTLRWRLKAEDTISTSPSTTPIVISTHSQYWGNEPSISIDARYFNKVFFNRSTRSYKIMLKLLQRRMTLSAADKELLNDIISYDRFILDYPNERQLFKRIVRECWPAKKVLFVDGDYVS
jgi:hypothetical protein